MASPRLIAHPQADLRHLMEQVAPRLLGVPNEALSDENELRYGRRGSLKVDLRTGTFIDFASNEGGGVLSLIELRLGLRGRYAWDWMRSAGILDGPPLENRLASDRKVDPSDQERIAEALKIWRQSAPAAGTPVETYLRSRHIAVQPPPTLRFHAALKHRSGTIWPAMVALVTGGVDNKPVGVHRTFLADDGSGKAPVEPKKMMLGPCRGGAVRLAAAGSQVMIGEGIETCLAAMTAMRVPAWAALSAGGMKTLQLPRHVRDAIVLADGDGPGEEAAIDAATRWRDEGRRVRIARPPQGCDFNDVLCQAESAP